MPPGASLQGDPISLSKNSVEMNPLKLERGSSRGRQPASSGIECPECLAWQGVQRAQRGLFRRAAAGKYRHFSALFRRQGLVLPPALLQNPAGQLHVLAVALQGLGAVLGGRGRPGGEGRSPLLLPAAGAQLLLGEPLLGVPQHPGRQKAAGHRGLLGHLGVQVQDLLDAHGGVLPHPVRVGAQGGQQPPALVRRQALHRQNIVKIKNEPSFSIAQSFRLLLPSWKRGRFVARSRTTRAPL